MAITYNSKGTDILEGFFRWNWRLLQKDMTKLMEWLTGFLAIFTVWLSILIGSNLAISHPNLTLFWPLLFIVIPFGLFSVAVIIYRVYNFNDCAEAAKELQSEIKTAREDLKKKGMVF